MKDLHVSLYKMVNYSKVDLKIKDGVGTMDTRYGPVRVLPVGKVNNSVCNHDGKSRFHAETIDLTQDKTVSGLLQGFQRGRAWWLLLHPNDEPNKPVILGYHYYHN